MGNAQRREGRPPLKEGEVGAKKTRNVNNLTEREQLFCDAYLGEAAGNPLAAMRLARPGTQASKSSLLCGARDILIRPRVREYLQKQIENDPLTMSIHERLRGLSDIARGEVQADGSVPTIDQRLKAMDQLSRAAGEHIKVEVTVKPETLSNAELEAMLLAAGVQIQALPVPADAPPAEVVEGELED